MDSAGPGCCQANAELARVFGITAGHESGSLFVTGLNESDFVMTGAKSFHDAVDAVSGQAENNFHSPIHQSFYEYICCSHK